MEKCKNCVWYIGVISGNESCANLSAPGIEKAEQCQYFLSRNDPVNHPAHYTNRQHECIDEMLTARGHTIKTWKRQTGTSTRQWS